MRCAFGYQLQLCRWFLGVNGSSHLVCSFGEHGEHAIVNVVVNEDDACGRFAYAIVDESVSIKDLTVVEDTLVWLYITAIQTTEDLFEVCGQFLFGALRLLIDFVPSHPSVGISVHLKR